MSLEETATMLVVRHRFKYLVDSGLLVSAKVCHEPEAESCDVCNGEDDRISITVCPVYPLEYVNLKFTLEEPI